MYEPHFQPEFEVFPDPRRNRNYTPQKYKVTKSDHKWRKAIRLSRKNTCERCGETPEEPCHVHHILTTRVYPSLAKDPMNVILVCAPCHSLFTRAEQTSDDYCLNKLYSLLDKDFRKSRENFLCEYSADIDLTRAFLYGESWQPIVTPSYLRE